MHFIPQKGTSYQLLMPCAMSRWVIPSIIQYQTVVKLNHRVVLQRQGRPGTLRYLLLTFKVARGLMNGQKPNKRKSNKNEDREPVHHE